MAGAEMSGEPISERAARHVAAFNDSVRSGEWADFARRFTPDATMRFVGIPVGPFCRTRSDRCWLRLPATLGHAHNYPRCFLRRRRRTLVRLGQQQYHRHDDLALER